MLTGSLVSGVTLAAEAEPLRVEYGTPGSCPSIDAFYAELAEWSVPVRRANDGELARVVTVTIVPRESTNSGRMTVVRLDGTRVTAETEGSCRDVVRELAGFAALALDPTATRRAAEPAEALENPYWPWLDRVEAICRQEALVASTDDLANPYRRTAFCFDDLTNPYRPIRLRPPERAPRSELPPAAPKQPEDELVNPYR